MHMHGTGCGSSTHHLAALLATLARVPWSLRFKDYQKAFINTSRFRPIQHVMGFVLILGYCLEYPHLKRAHEHRATAPSPPAPPQRPRAHRAHARRVIFLVLLCPPFRS
ncbi:MAG: hypothetical protein EB084_26165 [Proteobacteria bacterium]|nr:hypothetical protein [Pseudomonadota bacterium]